MLPDLLPNALAQDGTETNKERKSRPKTLQHQYDIARTGMIWYGRRRITNAMLYRLS
jgi:hypothetical protein